MHRFLLRTILLLILLAGFSTTGQSRSVVPPGGQDQSASQTLTSTESFIQYLPVVHRSDPPAWLGPFGGSTVVLLPDPVNTNIVYAGSWGAGVYKSVDYGLNWQPARAGLTNLSINSMTIDPLNPSTLYAGTYSSGVFKSTDGGETWAQASSGMQAGAIVYSLAIDPETPTRLYAGTRAVNTGGTPPPWSGIVYKSDDGAASWHPVLQNIGGSAQQDWVYSIAVLPLDPNLILAASHEHGIFRSWDYGETWAPANQGIVNGSGRGVVFDPQRRSPSTAYYGEWHRDGAYKTTNDGDSWAPLANGIQNTKIYSMAIDSSDPRYVYAATMIASAGDPGGAMRSSDAGQTWSQAGLQGLSVYTVAPNRANGNQLDGGVIGSAGIYRSENRGASWSASSQGMSNLAATSILAHGGAPSTIYTSNTVVLRSTDRGANWANLGSGLPGSTINALVMHPADANLLFALTNSGLYRVNLSAGTTWSKVAGLPGSAALSPVHPLDRIDELSALMPDEPLAPQPAAVPNAALNSLVFAPSNAGTAYLGGSGTGVYRSSDGAATWNPAGLSGQTIWSLAVDPTNPYLVYAAADTAGTVKVSQNGGANWTDTGLPAGTIPYTLVIDPAEPTRVYAGTSSGVYIRTGSGTWTLSGLNGRVVTALTLHPTRPGTLFAGTTAGVFISVDHAQSWMSGPYALETLGIEAITIDPDGYTVYYATSSSGVYRSSFQ
jgi:photosystem II stability/assembly factor-like uncharacterized protein